MVLRRFKIRPFQRGFRFVDGAFVDVLAEGTHWVLDPARTTRVDVVDVRDPWIRHKDLDVIVRRGVLNGEATTVDLAEDERALVWIDGRFETVLTPGVYALWTVFRRVVIEVIDASQTRFTHKSLRAVLGSRGLESVLRRFVVEPEHIGLFFEDGRFVAELRPGTHAFWMNGARVEVKLQDLRATSFDIAGQEIMTADQVTLRLNAMVTYRVVDALKAASVSDDARQALYREAQLGLRAAVGTRSLEQLLTDKESVRQELVAGLAPSAAAMGLDVQSVGIRDVILPGDMKELLNKVTEARKAAEAALITRREETAAARSQANTARLFEQNPTLMRLRELEVLLKVAEKANLTVVVGERGLKDHIVKLV